MRLFAAFSLILSSFSAQVSDADELCLTITEPTAFSKVALELAVQEGITVVFPSDLVRDLNVSPRYYCSAEIESLLQQMLNSDRLEIKQIGVNQLTLVERAEAKVQEAPLELELVEVTEILTTSSRLVVPPDISQVALDHISRSQLSVLPQLSLTELFKYQSAFSGNALSTGVTNGGSGAGSMTMRGLSANNTLVLRDGYRVASNPLTSAQADLNAFSINHTESINVLEESASALYGSDAQAGVVDIYTRRYIDGGQILMGGGSSGYGDRETLNLGAVFGQETDRLRWTAGLSAVTDQGLMSSDRDFSVSADGGAVGGADKRSSATAPAMVVTSDGERSTVTNGVITHFNNTDLYDYASATSLVVPLDRIDAFARITNKQDAFNWELIINASHYEAQSNAAPTPIYVAYDLPGVTVDADKSWNIYNTELTDIRRRMVEFGDRETTNEALVFSGSLKLDWQLEYSDWTLGLFASQSKNDELQDNLIDSQKLRSSLLYDEGPQLNLLAAPHNYTQDQIDWFGGASHVDADTRLAGVSLMADAELYESEEISVLGMFGAEIRHETGQLSQSDAPVLGGDSYAEYDAARSVGEVFFEMAIPVDWVGDSSWETVISLAGRYAYYSDFGQNFSPRYRITQQLGAHHNLQLSYGLGYRAPLLNELNHANTVSYMQLTDPCSQSNWSEFSGCLAQTDPSRYQYEVHYASNANLEPETSETITLYYQYQNRYFYLGLGLFRLKQYEVIQTDAQFILNDSANSLFEYGVVERDAQGEVLFIDAPLYNFGEREIEGLDLDLAYKWPIGEDTLRFNLDASYLFRFEVMGERGNIIDRLGQYRDAANDGAGTVPELKLEGEIEYSASWGELIWLATMVGEIQEFNSTHSVPAWWIHSLQYRSLVNAHGLAWNARVSNLFNQAPPILKTAFNDHYDARTYDANGRYFSFGFQFNF